MVATILPEILIIDDEEADIEIVRRVAKRVPFASHIDALSSGVEFLARINDPGSHLPDLVLLDLNLPGLNGKELLRRMRDSVRWQPVPVIVFSSSDAHSDVLDCYLASANAYVCKPKDLGGYEQAFASIASFWLGTARLTRQRTRRSTAC